MGISKTNVVYIISTDYGDWLLDEELNFCVEADEDLEPEMSIRIMDSSIAPPNTWDLWFHTLEDEEILEKIKPMIEKKVATLLKKAFEH